MISISNYDWKILSGIVVTCLFISITTHAVAVEVDHKKQVLLSRYLEQISQSPQDISADLYQRYMKQIRHVLKQSPKTISQNTMDDIAFEVKALVNQSVEQNMQFFEQVYPIYDSLLTVEELEMMVEFNQTPLGQKLLAVMPHILSETDELIGELELNLAPEINERLLEIMQSPP